MDKYLSTSGMGTKQWGPSGWNFLFSCIMGAYPPQIQPGNKQHREIRAHFLNLFQSLAYTMPCIFCRQSYASFLKEHPIEDFLGGRLQLMRWLYDIKDMVNNKLIQQEEQCYNNEKKRLKRLVAKGRLTEADYYTQVKAFKQSIFVTDPSPPFETVLAKYETYRAVCAPKAKTCVVKRL